MDAVRTLQRVIESDYRMAALETNDPERVVGLFKRLALTTGRATYHWQPESGLYRIGAEHILIPRTRSPDDLLSYVQAARHFGVYVIEGFDNAMGRGSIQRQLLNIVNKDDDVRRLMLFMGDRVRVPEGLHPYTATLRQNTGTAAAGGGSSQQAS
jgi:hypothetical protein